jgi:hypothetical protein
MTTEQHVPVRAIVHPDEEIVVGRELDQYGEKMFVIALEEERPREEVVAVPQEEREQCSPCPLTMIGFGFLSVVVLLAILVAFTAKMPKSSP